MTDRSPAGGAAPTGPGATTTSGPTAPGGAGSGLWPSRWPAEDGGPARLQAPHGGPALGVRPGERLEATARDALAATMVVLRDPGQAYLLRHTAGDDAVAWVERIDPVTLECRERSPDLPGGPTWPGGLAAHADGSLHVVFGRHAHRLSAGLAVEAARELPRQRPYNSFVVLPDGHLVTKDFGGALPPGVTRAEPARPAELLVLEPAGLAVVARAELPEPSTARLSAVGPSVYAVGDTALWHLYWDGRDLLLDEGFAPPYRTVEGQGPGWDAVLADGAAWFLDDGAGTERYAGTLRGCGVATAPLHLVRVDLATGAVGLTEVDGLPDGVVANPPAVDPGRRMVVAYDSGHGVVVGLAYDDDGRTERRWERTLDHGGHPLLFPATGEVLLGDHDRQRGAEQMVVLDVETGEERARVDTGSPVQSVVFPCPGFGRDVYLCSFTTLTRVAVVPG